MRRTSRRSKTATPALDVVSSASPESAHSRAQFPRPIHYRYVQVYLEQLEATGDVSDGAIAKHLEVRREALSRWRTRYPTFRKWVAERIEELAGEKGSAVVMRCANLALKGSVAHAELYLKATGRIGSETQAPAAPTINILNVPAPAPVQSWPGGMLPPAKV